jgi:hypothetical protein
MLPQGHLDEDYPFPCSAGVLGSADPANNPAEQSTSLCAGITPAGTYQPTATGTAAMACPTGSYCATGTSVPLPCEQGSYSNGTNLMSADECTPTQPGFFAPTGRSAPIACAAGSFAPTERLSRCTACPAGEYQDQEGATACVRCERGSYCPHSAPSPLGCESGAGIANAQTTVEAASSPADCVCSPGYYDAAQPKASQVDCTVCPSGSDCSGAGGFTLAMLPVKRGYYRLHERSVDVRRCPDAAMNCSDSPECPESTSGCRGTVNHSLASVRHHLEDEARGSLGCYGDLTGAFCLLCSPHPEGKRVYYAAATAARRAHCRECHAMARDTILIFFGIASFSIVVIALAYAWYVACLSRQSKSQLQYAWRVFTPQNKLKILVGFLIT